MEYPNLTLHIKNNFPSLEYHKSEDTVRRIGASKQGLDTLVMKAQEIIGSDYDNDELWQLVRSADEAYYDFVGFNFEGDWDFTPLLEELATEKEDFKIEPDLSPELHQELLKNWQQDMLASFIDAVYILIISNVLDNAAELAIESIVLDDEREEARLREKMGLVLAEMGIDLQLA